jgi:hypothetical protein
LHTSRISNSEVFKLARVGSELILLLIACKGFSCLQVAAYNGR